MIDCNDDGFSCEFGGITKLVVPWHYMFRGISPRHADTYPYTGFDESCKKDEASVEKSGIQVLA